MSPLIPQRSFKLNWDLSLKLRSQKTKPSLSPACSSTSFAVFCQSPALSSRSESCQYFSLSSKRAPLLTYSSPLPPLYAVLTFKGLVWPRAPQCHALGPEMPSPSLSYFLSLSNSLFYWPGWVSTINSVELCRGSGKWISSRVWAWLCWPWLRGVSRSWAGLADIISQIWAKTANVKCMHENFLDQFQRQQSQWGIQHRERIVVERGDRVSHLRLVVLGNALRLLMPTWTQVSDKKTGLNVPVYWMTM